MKLSLGTDIHCPNCKRGLSIETGFFASLFLSEALTAIEKRFKEEGGTITCNHCNKVSHVPPPEPPRTPFKKTVSFIKWNGDTPVIMK